MPISQDALLNPNRGSLCSLFLLGSQVCYERKYTRSVRIKLFLLNLAILYPFSFRAWARVLCVIKTSVIKAFPFQSYCICRFLITGNSMHCNRLLKRPCYCMYNFICSLFQSSGLDIFQSLWLTSSMLLLVCISPVLFPLNILLYAVWHWCWLFLLYCYMSWCPRQLCLSVELFSSILWRVSVCSQCSSRDLQSFPSPHFTNSS